MKRCGKCGKWKWRNGFSRNIRFRRKGAFFSKPMCNECGEDYWIGTK